MRRFTRAILLAVAVLGSAGCDGDSEAADVGARAEIGSGRLRPILPGGRVVLVTVDGVRWQEVFQGIDTSRSSERGGPEATLPRLSELVRTRGVALGAGQDGCGAVRASSGANLSMPGYLEIFTGTVTGCMTNDCPRVSRGTVFDEVTTTLGGVATSVDSWPVLEKTVTSGSDRVGVTAGTQAWHGPVPQRASDVVGLVAEHANVDPYPGAPGYRPDAYTAEIALAYLRSERPTLFHLGLGDTDEWAHKDDYGRYLGALRQADDVIGAIADRLDATGEAAKTTVIVAADHGRGANFKDHGASFPGSERSWVLAFGGGMRPRGVVCSASEVLLTDVAPTIRVLLGLPPDRAPTAGRPIPEIVEE